MTNEMIRSKANWLFESIKLISLDNSSMFAPSQLHNQYKSNQYSPKYRVRYFFKIIKNQNYGIT